MSTHTPGPWTVRRSTLTHDDAYDFAISGDGVPVFAEVFGRDANGALPPAEANALLIAAAPDLLGTLKAIRIELRAERTSDGKLAGVSYDMDALPRISNLLDVAIAKAEGH